MEKILLVVFGPAPAANSLDFACYLSGMTRSRIKGYFFESSQYADRPVMKQVYGMPYVETIVSGDLPGYETMRRTIEDNIRSFQHTCEEKGIPASAHYVHTPVLDEIITESRFADLIIVDAAASDVPGFEEMPGPFLRDLMIKAQCPVIIAPAGHMPVEEIVFCYDGSPSSYFAMKQFSYLLPELTEARGTVVQVSRSEIPAGEKKQVMDWLSRHFNYTDYVTLKGNPEDELLGYLLTRRYAMVVMGAYSRSMISRFFRHSHADLLIKTLAYPVFITHY
ncbi:universal stress protein [Chitinophaga japonensis]|uniref:Nucleotide-binding universal stress UspA family protein n=1 Tax=Chitinophaga japonensis TaxID=104662 RepID=A0A562SS90_CHIJA|nr:universal stress protein [Chitinophaga japonensis]TWI84127.1 hypothetical protein LX66_4489 [Chitinophaga japonensis]